MCTHTHMHTLHTVTASHTHLHTVTHTHTHTHFMLTHLQIHVHSITHTQLTPKYILKATDPYVIHVEKKLSISAVPKENNDYICITCDSKLVTLRSTVVTALKQCVHVRTLIRLSHIHTHTHIRQNEGEV